MGIIRNVIVYEALDTHGIDFLVVARQIELWSALETFFALVAFCLPSFRLLIEHRGGLRVAAGEYAPRVQPRSAGGRKDSLQSSESSSMGIELQKTFDVTYEDRSESQTELALYPARTRVYITGERVSISK
jgi:hypothetical protein